MFNISFGEMFIVCAVGLVVIGPDRLPQAARFVGHLFGRLQRQISSVKADIRREMHVADLNKMKQEAETAARSVDRDVRSTAKDIADTATADGEKPDGGKGDG